MKRPYLLKKRGKYWYYRLSEEQTFHSTGQTARSRAENFVQHLIIQSKDRSKIAEATDLSLLQYASPYFVWEKCPHVRRLLDEGKSITKRHAKKQRRWMENHLFPDRISKLKMDDITRAEILDYRSRLIKKLGDRRNTINKVMSALKTIFKEALFREEISRDPTYGIGNIKEYRQKPGTFTVEELKQLFPSGSLGPWRDRQDYSCFFLSACTGMRRGEIFALKWRFIDFKRQYLSVEEAWKGGREIGDPKWGKKRRTPLPRSLIAVLQELHQESIRIAPDDLVFCYDDGSMLGETWWQKRFDKALVRAGINKKDRNLKPHSFRHTLNSVLRGFDYDDRKIQAALGWSDTRTQEGYTTWDMEQLREQADIVDKIFEGE